MPVVLSIFVYCFVEVLCLDEGVYGAFNFCLLFRLPGGVWAVEAGVSFQFLFIVSSP